VVEKHQVRLVGNQGHIRALHRGRRGLGYRLNRHRADLGEGVDRLLDAGRRVGRRGDHPEVLAELVAVDLLLGRDDLDQFGLLADRREDQGGPDGLEWASGLEAHGDLIRVGAGLAGLLDGSELVRLEPDARGGNLDRRGRPRAGAPGDVAELSRQRRGVEVRLRALLQSALDGAERVQAREEHIHDG